MKLCSVCLERKPYEAFTRDRSRADGLASRCAACDRDRARSYYERHTEGAAARRDRRRARQKAGSPPRVCKDCGKPAKSRRHWYCETCGRRHAKAHGRKRARTVGNTVQRGYGAAHQREREKWAKLIANGGVTCSRPECGRPIYPDDLWDLDHTDDRAGYLGPSHRSCNRAAGARKVNAKRFGIPGSSSSPSATTRRLAEVRESARLPGW